MLAAQTPVKTVVLRVPEEFHKKLKLHCVENNNTLQNYIVSLIEQDLEKDQNEDKG